MGNIVAIAVAVVALVAGAYGLGIVMFERGYVHGYEAARPGGDIDFSPDKTVM